MDAMEQALREYRQPEQTVDWSRCPLARMFPFDVFTARTKLHQGQMFSIDLLLTRTIKHT